MRHWRTRQTTVWQTAEEPSKILLEAVNEAYLPLPVSHDDLTGIYVALALLGIQHNLTGSRSWWTGMYEAQAVRPPYPWCSGNPTIVDCLAAGYCRRDPTCGD